jgi:NADH-quinone oxidoreductase subunit J
VNEAAFFIFSALTLLCGVLVIVNRNPVTAAMCLVLCIVSLAGLFVLLEAYFLAAVQVLVYAGAVMVLFLFVIMLLNLKEEERRRIQIFRGGAAFLVVVALLSIIVRTIWTSKTAVALPSPALAGETAPLGLLLFNKFLLPFEILSILLLVAMVGAILLSKKDLR